MTIMSGADGVLIFNVDGEVEIFDLPVDGAGVLISAPKGDQGDPGWSPTVSATAPSNPALYDGWIDIS